jgi:hypothetical protein
MTDDKIIKMANQVNWGMGMALIVFARLIERQAKEESISLIREVLHDQSPSGMLAAVIRSQQ